MIDLGFSVASAGADRYAASPMLALKLRISENSGAKVDSIALRVQVRLDVQRRRYAAAESALLEELFGGPSRYAETLRSMLWTHVTAMVPAFQHETELELPIPCSYDFEVASHKYLASLKDGIIPLNLLFSGMAFVDRSGRLTPEFVPWSCEARFALPVAVWREAVDALFPNSAWIRVNRDLFDELRRFKIATGLPTWDAALERLCEIAKLNR
ncbi:MAG: DUF6084 family protein [Candidatus Cybelea sp.]